MLIRDNWEWQSRATAIFFKRIHYISYREYCSESRECESGGKNNDQSEKIIINRVCYRLGSIPINIKGCKYRGNSAKLWWTDNATLKWHKSCAGLGEPQKCQLKKLLLSDSVLSLLSGKGYSCFPFWIFPATEFRNFLWVATQKHVTCH